MTRFQSLLTLAALASACATLSGCARDYSGNVKQSQIYTSYSARYLEGDETLELQATFNFGGSTGTYLELTPPSTIEADDSPLTVSTSFLGQVNYEKSVRTVSESELAPSYVFSYVDNEGKSYRNEFSMPRLARSTSPAANSTHPTTHALEVQWASPDDLGDDRVSVQMISSDGSYLAYADSEALPSARSGVASFSPDELTSVAGRTVKLRLCRSRPATAVEAPSEGGSLSILSCAEPVSIRVQSLTAPQGS